MRDNDEEEPQEYKIDNKVHVDSFTTQMNSILFQLS